MTIDEMEELATGVVNATIPADGRGQVLARALLAVMPTVRAADAWVSADEGEDRNEADKLTYEVMKLRRGGKEP